NSKIALEIVRVLNVPTSTEIDDVVRRRGADIERYYRENRDRYQRNETASVRYFELAIPPGLDAEGLRKLEAEAEKLRLKARVEDFGALAEAYSTDPISAPHGGRMPPVGRHKMPVAFETPVGKVSELQKDAR